MNIKGLSDVFVASGVNEIDDKTFTALFYGYEIRGKVKAPAIPTVEFFFYGNVYIDQPSLAEDFINGYEEKFGHAKFRFSDKYVSVLIDMGGLDAPKVKERLAAVGNFMISNGFGAIALQPEEPEPEPEPEPKSVVEPAKIQAKPQPKMKPAPQQTQQQVQQQRQPPKQPVYEEPKVPFEEHRVLEKLVQIFLMGINKVSYNTFTTIYHGYNIVGKMLSPVKDDIEIIFYGDLTQNVTEEFAAFQNELNEKYGKVPIRMVGGSCDAILYLDGKDITQCKEILGQISGFMIKHSIAAINLPNTIGSPVATYTAESYKAMMNNAPNSRRSSASSAPSTPMTFGATAPTPIANGAPPITENDGNNFAKNFLKKFSKKP